MRVGVVHTAGSPCGCAQAISRALVALGHDPMVVDSEEIEDRAGDLALRCDLVVDHTDTFRGRGLFRPVVRQMLEARGARIAGSGSAACFLADDKPACRGVLSRVGVPIPPGLVLRKGQELPAWLQPPVVVKAAFEHMSRGAGLARTREEVTDRVARIAETLRQPALVESYVAGRELGIAVVDGPDGLEVLPPVEWEIGEWSLFGEEAKAGQVEPPPAVPANLPEDRWHEVRAMALGAFRALGLQDYARFDVRLSRGGTPYFLEANTKPSLEEDQALALAASWAGLGYVALIQRILEAAQRRGGTRGGKPGMFSVSVAGRDFSVEVPAGVHAPPRSSLELARLLDVRAGEAVLDLGCGSGIFALAAAQLGAGRVVAVDLDGQALAATRRNAERHGVARCLECRAGSWYEALPEPGAGESEHFGLIVAAPPQLPGLDALGPKWGGPDGLRHLRAVVDGAPRRLAPGTGRLWLLHTSLADPRGFHELLAARFRQVSVAGETEREFTAEEYDALAPGLFAYLLDRRARGQCEFEDRGRGRFVFLNRFFRLADPR